jgi:hypothetical protein
MRQIHRPSFAAGMIKHRSAQDAANYPPNIPAASLETLRKFSPLPRPTRDFDNSKIDFEIKQEAEKIVDGFLKLLQSSGNPSLAYAGLNDRVLRRVMRFPVEIQDNRALLSKKIADIRNACQKQVLDSVSGDDRRKMAQWLENLESSVLQISRFVRNKRESEPSALFATSVLLDVFHGIDLLRAKPRMMNEHEMEIVVSVYQAKASREGLQPGEVRSIWQDYQHMGSDINERFVIDPDWYVSQVEKSLGDVTKKNINNVLADAKKTGDYLAQLADSVSDDPHDRYVAAYVKHQVLRQLAKAIGQPVPALPQIRLFQDAVHVGFLVDVVEMDVNVPRRMTKALSADAAKNYGKKAAA